ncbi:NADPH-dependent FMN reductase [Chitinophaga sp. Cy-1792]|uniref:NADPH-dependent FMN reductase n=1 Tax=Chitinophaga sp. Cy-1792 TaxID=2608339 RepID=UPI00141EC10C|nr:NADPH-dependent FMN reductase [Chitinophaga sp. Cy-1792]NIG53006.1 flavoprotein [Chitinophaga sp. Cy-1792]
MKEKISVLAISGSTRAQSSNHQLIHGITKKYADKIAVTFFDDLTTLPFFNPDIDNETPPASVTAFREAVRAADAVLICTPEYAIGVPGVLKNALDWAVSNMAFSQKPVALITAGTAGFHAHKSLLGTLLIIESSISEDMQLVISAVKTKIDTAGNITNTETSEKINKLIDATIAAVQGNSDLTFLQPPPMMQA